MNIKELKKDLPIGAMSEIAKMSGVNSATVQKFFNGEKTKANILLIKTTTKYLGDYKAKETKALQELQAVATA
jgi:DNA-binding transcriptional regulator YhcF (GntR family)